MAFEQIWAPWRLGYIVGDKDLPELDDPASLLPGAEPHCFLCQCAADKADRERLTVYRAEHSIAVLNRYPYNNGHLLVAPKRHWARLDEMDAESQLETTQTIARMVRLLEKTIAPEGFNIGINLGRVAGAGLPGHLHWHIVPRWNGDTNFMSSIAGVNVIPQSLDALWELLTTELRK